MLRRSPNSLCGLIAFISLLLCATPQALAADRLVELLRIVPADAHAAVVIPNLKRTSDDLTRMLEGMDRSGILLGARPIDQLKSQSGFNTAIDDQGSAAIILTDSAASPPHIVTILPAENEKDFLEGNFTGRASADDGTAFTRADGSRMFARSIDSHIAMSGDSAMLQAYQPGAGLGESLLARLGERGIAGLADADAVVVLRSPMIKQMRQRVLAPLAERGVALPGAAAMLLALADELEAVIITVQFDPLALIAHCTAVSKTESVFGSHATSEIKPDAGLSRIPDGPAAFALSIDFAALGGEAMWKDIAAAMQDQPEAIPLWLKTARSLQLVIAPSEAGAKAGLLNGAAIILAGDEPAKLRDALKNDLEAAGKDANAGRSVKWTDAQKLTDGSTADAFEIRTNDAPAMQASIEAVLFGASGFRGYVRTLESCVVMTMAQRQNFLASITQTASMDGREAASGPHPSDLSGSAVVKVMREWMPSQRDVEAYLGAAQLTGMLSPYERLLPLNGFALPQFDAGAPPIGFAADVTKHRVDAALIVPAQVLAPAFDEVVRFMKNRGADADQP